ncbi:MAG: HNH endonuclease [Desulfamplus sp.]|nr:HNH endonuclease [Desulfamplus sp.]
MDYYYFDLDEKSRSREKQKARELKQTEWWKRRRARGICHYCRGNFLPAELTMDHIVPMVRGGRSVKNNVVPCCKECNTKKKHMLPLEWEEYMNSLADSQNI